MEVVTAIRRHLLADGTVNGYVSGKGFKHRLLESIDGTGGYAFVVRLAGGWAPPSPGSFAEFPLIEIECWADHDRDDNGDMAEANGADKATGLYRAINNVLHARIDERWGGTNRYLRVIRSDRWREPRSVEQSQFEAAKLTVQYALQVVHGTVNGVTV